MTEEGKKKLNDPKYYNSRGYGAVKTGNVDKALSQEFKDALKSKRTEFNNQTEKENKEGKRLYRKADSMYNGDISLNFDLDDSSYWNKDRLAEWLGIRDGEYKNPDSNFSESDLDKIWKYMESRNKFENDINSLMDKELDRLGVSNDIKYKLSSYIFQVYADPNLDTWHKD